MIYADDTQVYIHCSTHDLLNGIRKAQRDAQAVADWAAQNGLDLNLKKTDVIIIGSELYISAINFDLLPEITISTTKIPYSNSVKSLGVTISSTLQ